MLSVRQPRRGVQVAAVCSVSASRAVHLSAHSLLLLGAPRCAGLAQYALRRADCGTYTPPVPLAPHHRSPQPKVAAQQRVDTAARGTTTSTRTATVAAVHLTNTAEQEQQAVRPAHIIMIITRMEKAMVTQHAAMAAHAAAAAATAASTPPTTTVTLRMRHTTTVLTAMGAAATALAGPATG